MQKRQKIVFVGLSGGVDSAVSVILLKKQDYEVVGVFIRSWHPDYLPCNEEDERKDAMRIAAHLDIPFLTFDFADIYKKKVADYMIQEYKKGRTPNPDVMCNKEVKFGVFLTKAISMGADYIATGHYARKRDIQESLKSTSLYFLKGVDSSKDQSYFLWSLKQNQLAKTLFPIGHLKKSQVRSIAREFDLPIAKKKDSQGICFLGDVNLKQFLKHYIKEKKGKILNKDNKEIGYHNGAVFYTLGERHGFTITKKTSKDKPYYIIDKNIKKNILIVSQDKNISYPSILKKIHIKNTNWISMIPKKDKIYQAQIRYHGEFLPCKIDCGKIDIAQAQIVFEKPTMIASGQSCVIYDRDICLGGGIVV
jgi:tRNA-uridine 2-sulfurtransferase